MIKRILNLIFVLSFTVVAQIKPVVTPLGGDENPVLKQKIQHALEQVLLEMNRVQKGSGALDLVKPYFSPESFDVFKQFTEQNKPYTTRRTYEPQMVSKPGGRGYDIRSITVSINTGETETSDKQNLLFGFDADGTINSIRSVLPNFNYHKMIAEGTSVNDSIMRDRIMEFIEQFRMAYNTKNIDYLDKVYSDDALIIVGSFIQPKKGTNEVMNRTLLTEPKLKLVQLTKEQYIGGLRKIIAAKNSFINVSFDSLHIVRHEKFPYIYGISCRQHWKSSGYADRGYLFLMMDFRRVEEPTIHVRTWQPKAFEEDDSYVSLYDFDIIEY